MVDIAVELEEEVANVREDIDVFLEVVNLEVGVVVDEIVTVIVVEEVSVEVEVVVVVMVLVVINVAVLDV